jgi:hypothetical protein
MSERCNCEGGTGSVSPIVGSMVPNRTVRSPLPSPMTLTVRSDSSSVLEDAPTLCGRVAGEARAQPGGIAVSSFEVGRSRSSASKDRLSWMASNLLQVGRATGSQVRPTLMRKAVHLTPAPLLHSVKTLPSPRRKPTLAACRAHGASRNPCYDNQNSTECTRRRSPNSRLSRLSARGGPPGVCRPGRGRREAPVRLNVMPGRPTNVRSIGPPPHRARGGRPR